MKYKLCEGVSHVYFKDNMIGKTLTLDMLDIETDKLYSIINQNMRDYSPKINDLIRFSSGIIDMDTQKLIGHYNVLFKVGNSICVPKTNNKKITQVEMTECSYTIEALENN